MNHLPFGPPPAHTTNNPLHPRLLKSACQVRPSPWSPVPVVSFGSLISSDLPLIQPPVAVSFPDVRRLPRRSSPRLPLRFPLPSVPQDTETWMFFQAFIPPLLPVCPEPSPADTLYDCQYFRRGISVLRLFCPPFSWSPDPINPR